MKLTKSQEYAIKCFESGKSFFLTGKAGTGKSFVTRHIIELCKDSGKQVLVCAPTGIAAVNVGGATIHSTFQAPIGVVEPDAKCCNRKKLKVLEAADVIIIDEISMCRADLFDYVIRTLLSLKLKKEIQLILVGDFYQLPPVLVDNESDAYHAFYKSIYPFMSKNWKNAGIETVELKEMVRTDDTALIDALDKIRVGIPAFDVFKKQKKPDTEAVSICATNNKAHVINAVELGNLKRKYGEEGCRVYNGDIFGSFTSDLPTEKCLVLMPEARVMLLNNTEHWVNGTTATVVGVHVDSITVQLDTNGNLVTVEEYKWTQYGYSVEKQDGKDKLVKNEIGTYLQLPVKLAWAITVHKSQGQTYEKVNIHTAGMFCEGQLYVALSRCKSLAGMKIIGELSEKGLICSKEVQDFMAESVVPEQSDECPIRPKKKNAGGRPFKYTGYVTKVMRIPEVLVDDVKEFVDRRMREIMNATTENGLPSG